MKTAVITTGGLGTRLLTCTKGNPKTMLPLYDKPKNVFSEPLLRPLIEIIFENLYDFGFRRFCFIVGEKTKTSILNHMLPDTKYLKLLKKRNIPEDRRFINTLMRLYTKIINSEIEWVSQPTPMGFGDALLKSRKFVGSDTFLLHAGDTYFPSYHFLNEFIKKYENSSQFAGSLLLKRMRSLKGYGVAQINKKNKENIVFHVKEKPKKPQSNLAILPVYAFNPKIYDALENTVKGYNRELQVTDAIQSLIDMGEKVSGFILGNRSWFDIGTPHNYFKALTYSYKKATK